MNANLAIERFCAQHAFVRARSALYWLLILPMALILAACGGGGGGSSETVSQPTLAITQQPADQSTTAGNAATFRIAMNGAATIQWQRLGTDGQWADLPGATQAELALTGLTEADNGRKYRAQLRAGTVVLTSSIATLTVSPLPVPAAVAAQPTDVQLRVGQVPSFSVTATGTSVSYQWQSSTDGLAWADVAGATTETLMLPAATLADSGRMYRVMVRNGLAAVTSRAVTLSVLPPLAKPLFTAQPQDRSVEAGLGATFTATVSGEPVPTLQWETSLDGQSWTTVAGATTSTLVVANAALADNGRRYRAVATNSEGRELSAIAKLTVTAAPAAPSFLRQPQPAVVMQSQAAAFEAEADGNPTPTYQWQVSLDGGQSFTNINGATGARLDLPTTVDADEGKLFRVLASNRLGDVASTAARLTLLRLPQVTLQPQDVISGVADANVTVTVAGTGSPAPAVQWQFSSDDGATYQDFPGATQDSFTFAPASAQLVRAKLSNAAGVAYSRAVRISKARWTSVSPSFVGTRLNSVRWLDSRIAVAVGNQGTVVRTTDGGATWAFIKEPTADSPHLLQLAVLDSHTVIAAGSNGVMIRSEDAGRTWNFIPIPAVNVSSLSFRNASVGVLASFTDGAFRTVDGGLTWTRIQSADPAKPLEKLSSIALRATLGFAVGRNGWFRSTDGGASWNALDLPASDFPQGLVSVTFVDDQTLAIANGPFARSTDGGQTWQAVPPISGLYAPRSALRFSRDGQVGIDLEGSMRSTDRGQTWAWRGVYTSFTDVDFSPDNVAIGVGGNGELRLSTDQGATWGAPYGSQGLEGANLWGVAFPGNDDYGVAVGSLGNSMVVHQTADGGRTWALVQQVPDPGGAIQGAPVVFFDGQVGVAPSYGPLLRTADGGRSWTKLPNPGSYTNGVALLGRDTMLLSSLAGVHRSVDGGNNWTAVQSVWPHDFELQPQTISARGNVVLAPTLQGKLHRSTDGGDTWSTGTYSGSWPASIAWTSNSTVFILNVRGALSRSDDAGVTWREVRAEPQPVEFYGQISFSADGRLGFMVSNSTIYRTSDGGQSWNRDVVRPLGWLKGVGFVGSNKPVVVGQDGAVLLGDGY